GGSEPEPAAHPSDAARTRRADQNSPPLAPDGARFLRLISAIIASTVGAWRSLVAHLHGVQGVASSNLVAPTNTYERQGGVLWTHPWTHSETAVQSRLTPAARGPMSAIVRESEVAFIDRVLEAWGAWSRDTGIHLRVVNIGRILGIAFVREAEYFLDLSEDALLLVDRTIAKLPP